MAEDNDEAATVAAARAAAEAAIRELNYDAAQAALDAPLRQWPDRVDLLIQHAWVAFYRGDMPEAARRWLTVVLLHGNHSAAWVGLGRSLVNLRRVDMAEAILAVAARGLPDDTEIMIGRAELLVARQDWPGALRAWTALAARDPRRNVYDSRLGEARWHVQFEQAEAGASAAPGRVDVGSVENPLLRDLLMGFESLGGNCEFGLVQRRYGAEPLALLRWNTTTTEALLRMLEAGFAGLGDDATTTIASEPPGEYYIGDTVYGLHLHTFIHEHQEEAASVLAKQCRRIRRLREMMLERLREGGRIFVFKTASPDALAEGERVHAALQRYGRNTLLLVRHADTANPAGTVRQIRPGLLAGHVDRLNPNAPGAMIMQWDIAFDAWVDVCAAAAGMLKQAAAPLTVIAPPAPAVPPPAPPPPRPAGLTAWDALRVPDAPPPGEPAPSDRGLLGKLFGRR